MNTSDVTQPKWLQLCAAAGVDPLRRMAARLAILGDAAALDCTLYRGDELDEEAEEDDLGDARLLLTGAFEAPDSWSEEQRSAFFDGLDPQLFARGLIECLASPGSATFFVAEIGDYVASMSASGEVQMYFVHDCKDDEQGRHCVLIRDDQPLF